MTRLRTHNNRARRLPYAVYKARVRRATKIARFAVMYGAGPRKMREALQGLGHAAMNAATELGRYRTTHREFVDRYFLEEHGELHIRDTLERKSEIHADLMKRMGK